MRPNWYLAGLYGVLHPNTFFQNCSPLEIVHYATCLLYLFFVNICRFLIVEKNSNFLTYHTKISKGRAENYSKRQFREQWEI